MNTTTLSPVSYPIYHFARQDLIPGFSDVYSSIAAPTIVYWVVSLLFQLIDISELDIFERYRIHESDEAKSKNRVTPSQVVWAVLLQQLLQTALGLAVLEKDDPKHGPFRDHAGELEQYFRWIANGAVALLGKQLGGDLVRRFGPQAASWVYWWGVPTFQFFFAAFILDAWQYFWHRYFHVNTFLYRHVHSWHHRLYVPYAFGALYNHPLEGFVFDSCGAAFAHYLAGMTTRQAILFFAISSAKTVDDHCGFAFPWDPLQHLFGNNADYHDIHHQIAGLKTNFSQPYFIHFDYFLGTRLTRHEFEARKAARRNGKPAPVASLNGPNELGAPPSSKKNHLPLKDE